MSSTGKISRSALREEGREALRIEYLRVKARQKEVAAQEPASNDAGAPKNAISELGPIAVAPGFSIYGDDDDLFVPASGLPAAGGLAIFDDMDEFNDWMVSQEVWTSVIRANVLPPDTATVGLKVLWQCVDILDWWATHEAQYPTIAQIARRYLAYPASQSFQERVFSGSKIVMTAKRCSLTSWKFEQLTILCHNKIWLRGKREENKKRKALAMSADSATSLVKREMVENPIS